MVFFLPKATILYFCLCSPDRKGLAANKYYTLDQISQSKHGLRVLTVTFCLHLYWTL